MKMQDSITIGVTAKVKKGSGVRLKIATWLIKLAALIGRVEVEVSTEQIK